MQIISVSINTAGEGPPVMLSLKLEPQDNDELSAACGPSLHCCQGWGVSQFPSLPPSRASVSLYHSIVQLYLSSPASICEVLLSFSPVIVLSSVCQNHLPPCRPPRTRRVMGCHFTHRWCLPTALGLFSPKVPNILCFYLAIYLHLLRFCTYRFNQSQIGNT